MAEDKEAWPRRRGYRTGYEKSAFKLKKKREKPFIRRPRTNVEESEMSALTQADMLEAVVDDDHEENHSSVDSDLDTKLISPVAKKQLYSTMERSPDRSPSTPTTSSKQILLQIPPKPKVIW